jgi:hypothetical protein
MKRDLDLIRRAMLALEENNTLNGRAMRTGTATHLLGLTAYSDDDLAYHLMLIMDEDFMDGQYHRTSGHFAITRITASGHDFIDSTRNPDVWQKVRSMMKAGGSETLRLAWDLAKTVARAEITRHLCI